MSESDFYVKLPVLGKIKRLTCLVLRGKEVDREILISCQMLKRWDMIHSTFPAQTISQYIRNLDRNLCNTLDQNKINAIYEKSKITTKEKLSKTNRPCTKLREHILKECHDVFKEYLDPTDRVNIEPVHLEVDESRNINPVQVTNT